MDAINLANIKSVDAICTLPINKESWGKAKLKIQRSYRSFKRFL